MVPKFTLDPAMPVLLRPDGVVQIGWDPRRAVLVRPPRGLTAGDLARLLRSAGGDVDRLRTEAVRLGAVDSTECTELIGALVAAGVARPGAGPSARAAAVRIHGQGPLTELLIKGLRGTGVRVSHSSQPHAVVRADRTDLVVLADYLVADPHLVRELHRAQIPHLLVRMRDGTGIVGPLVLPGSTSCLGCADLYRRDRDDAWPALAAQLRDLVGVADHSAVLATAALALGQIRSVVAAVGADGEDHPKPPPPSTLSATLEVDVGTGSIAVRRWPRHPLCPC